MRLASFVFAAGALFAASGVPLDVTDTRNKRAPGVTVEASGPDAEGWWTLRVSKFKRDTVLIWPWDAMAKQPDGPEPVPVIVIQRGESKALENPRVVAAIATPVVLGLKSMPDAASATGLSEDAIRQAIRGLATAADSFAKGIGLLYSGKSEAAADELAKALRERQRQLTRVPSEIFPAAMLYGHALMGANKFDLAAVAYLNAVKIRPSDENARTARAEALMKAGKAEAAAEAGKR
jgi:tetratricopeptide (TPR) repeat protein